MCVLLVGITGCGTTATEDTGLVEAVATGSSRKLVEPGQPDESYLFFKLAAATDPSLGYPIAGSPMPSFLLPPKRKPRSASRSTMTSATAFRQSSRTARSSI
jgi:hypothetical protein